MHPHPMSDVSDVPNISGNPCDKVAKRGFVRVCASVATKEQEGSVRVVRKGQPGARCARSLAVSNTAYGATAW